MKKMKKMSKRTTALIAAAMLLLTCGTVTGTRAALNIQSEYYRAQFYLNHLQVHLVENGEDVCGEVNTLDGGTKVTGRLASALGYRDDDNLGSVEPGKTYREEIAARNGQKDTDEFVRLTVRKFWAATDENGKVLRSGKNIVKSDLLNPAQIHLMYGGKDGYNESAWTENVKERTEESRTYYYKSVLPAGADSDLLFDKVMIDRNIVQLARTIEGEENGKKTFTYEYKYDGCVFYIEADVQSIQTHNINDAIKSQWGVDNVTGQYDVETGHGSLTVSN